jgi:hypothetical protein
MQPAVLCAMTLRQNVFHPSGDDRCRWSCCDGLWDAAPCSTSTGAPQLHASTGSATSVDGKAVAAIGDSAKTPLSPVYHSAWLHRLVVGRTILYYSRLAGASGGVHDVSRLVTQLSAVTRVETLLLAQLANVGSSLFRRTLFCIRKSWLDVLVTPVDAQVVLVEPMRISLLSQLLSATQHYATAFCQPTQSRCMQALRQARHHPVMVALRPQLKFFVSHKSIACAIAQLFCHMAIACTQHVLVSVESALVVQALLALDSLWRRLAVDAFDTLEVQARLPPSSSSPAAVFESVTDAASAAKGPGKEGHSSKSAKKGPPAPQQPSDFAVIVYQSLLSGLKTVPARAYERLTAQQRVSVSARLAWWYHVALDDSLPDGMWATDPVPSMLAAVSTSGEAPSLPALVTDAHHGLLQPVLQQIVAELPHISPTGWLTHQTQSFVAVVDAATQRQILVQKACDVTCLLLMDPPASTLAEPSASTSAAVGASPQRPRNSVFACLYERYVTQRLLRGCGPDTSDERAIMTKLRLRITLDVPDRDAVRVKLNDAAFAGELKWGEAVVDGTAMDALNVLRVSSKAFPQLIGPSVAQASAAAASGDDLAPAQAAAAASTPSSHGATVSRLQHDMFQALSVAGVDDTRVQRPEVQNTDTQETLFFRLPSSLKLACQVYQSAFAEVYHNPQGWPKLRWDLLQGSAILTLSTPQGQYDALVTTLQMLILQQFTDQNVWGMEDLYAQFQPLPTAPWVAALAALCDASHPILIAAVVCYLTRGFKHVSLASYVIVYGAGWLVQCAIRVCADHALRHHWHPHVHDCFRLPISCSIAQDPIALAVTGSSRMMLTWSNWHPTVPGASSRRLSTLDGSTAVVVAPGVVDADRDMMFSQAVRPGCELRDWPALVQQHEFESRSLRMWGPGRWTAFKQPQPGAAAPSLPAHVLLPLQVHHALWKVLKQVHPETNITATAWSFLNCYIAAILTMLVQGVQDLHAEVAGACACHDVGPHCNHLRVSFQTRPRVIGVVSCGCLI